MSEHPARSERPNIVVILADDMGYSDIGCFGSEIHTPNLDQLAKQGVRFTQMYNYARCCPTRACLLTGLYPHQAGVGHMVNNYGLPEYQGYLRDDCVTIAEVLGSAGYRTMLSGKWHVGGIFPRNDPNRWQIGDPERPLPLDRGFDDWYGTPSGAGSYFNPRPLFDQYTIIEPEDDSCLHGNTYHYTDAVSDHAVHMIDNAAQGDQPFFLHVTYTAPHWPLHAFEKDIAQYQGTYRGGWDAVRTARHEEMIGMGILDAKWSISPRDEKAPPWDDIKRREWEDRRMAVYAAQVHHMDRGIGRIVNKLRELDLYEDTLILFLSDNGGCAELLREDGQRAKEWPVTLDGREVRFGNVPDLMPGDPATYQSYDLPWANASNTPFRLYKHWVHEGGISTPLIAHWPRAISQASLDHSIVHIVDIMATCCDAAGVDYPDEYDGRPVQALEGESFLPVLRGEKWQRKHPLFWEHEGNCAVRDGSWKLVRKYPGNWELYDMFTDRTELDDLAAKNQPQKVKMIQMYETWANRCGVLPWDQVRALPRR